MHPAKDEEQFASESLTSIVATKPDVVTTAVEMDSHSRGMAKG